MDRTILLHHAEIQSHGASPDPLGYLQRRSDPADGRAKLIRLTEQGWGAITAGRAILERIETDWAKAVGQEQFEMLC
jgi:DNA-binding MarR family transcriptional regulator